MDVNNFENPDNGYIKAPPPWRLRGDAYILLIKPSVRFVQDLCFVPASLSGQFRGGFGVVMFVNYRSSDVGPYQELLIMPGKFAVSGKRVYSITRIYVSTWESVINGRNNWGISKEKADFRIERTAPGIERIRAWDGDHLFADLMFRSYPINVLFSSSIIPAGWRTIGQVYQGRSYLTRMDAKGRVHPARLMHARVDSLFFPDFTVGRPIAAVRFENFDMTFHSPLVRPA